MIIYSIPFWKEAPCVRLVIPLIAGIIIQYYILIPAQLIWPLLLLLATTVAFIGLLPITFRYRYMAAIGGITHCMLVFTGMAITLLHDNSAGLTKTDDLIRQHKTIIAALKSPPTEKTKTWRMSAEFAVDPPIGLLLYCSKTQLSQKESNELLGDSLVASSRKIPALRDSPRGNAQPREQANSPPNALPKYGQRIAFRKTPRPIENLPIFGDFDYKRYCALKNIHYQIFLHPEDFVILPGSDRDPIQAFLFDAQQWTTKTLTKYIPGKKEAGLAEALLIGYKEDLDKSLTQSYSATGVMHVVAISGLHLGLIYAILRRLCAPLKRQKGGKWFSAMFILIGLWLFSLLAGGSPSILRSTVMFTTIVVGDTSARKSSLYNNLAASALFLLAANPNSLWDIGFQLSYAALLSIGLFQKPIYLLVVWENRAMDAVWQLIAVTLAAQILTLPISIFYFHQFPNLFLISNLVAVPASSIILVGEIGLCAIAFFPMAAVQLGKLLSIAINVLNSFVEWLGHISFANTGGIYISLVQMVTLYVLIFGLALWLMTRRIEGVFTALVSAITFFALDL